MKIILAIAMLLCALPADAQSWIVDRFDDVKVLRYEVDGFEELPLEEKLLVYYLSEAAVYGRDIVWDQNFRHNLAIRNLLEGIYFSYTGDRSDADFVAFETYLKKVWFANGIHHHYSMAKFVPKFSETWFDGVAPAAGHLKEIIFNPELYPMRVNQAAGEDLLATSAMNYYEGVTQAEAESFYAAMVDPSDKTPMSYGLNSKLVKENGKLSEQVWRVGGMYDRALFRIVDCLEKAAKYARGDQKRTIELLVEYYKSGDLHTFDRFNIAWVEDTASRVDFVNGFTETYGDPLGRKASWESVVNFKDLNATRRSEIISDNAQWFEDNSPVAPQFRKPVVKGVSAKVITAAMLGGDCYPATPIGINLPNADWIRRDHGSKSVTIENITYAYDQAAKGNGFQEEFVLRNEDRERMTRWGSLGGNLHTDLHECLGHGSGRLAPGVKGDEMKQYGSAIEEARADLFALYYIADPKMVELGLIPTLDVAWAEYASYMMNGLMTQMARIEVGANIEESHMRNRAAVANWCYERGGVEIVQQGGKRYVVVPDFEKLRELVGELLGEVQRIKSTGDFEAGKNFIENYGVKVDRELHAEVLERYNSLGLAPYSGFVNPRYELVLDRNGSPEDVVVVYGESYVDQMKRYGSDYGTL